jgi:endoglucanase
MLSTVKALCALSGVSSFEDEVRAYIRSRVEPYADRIQVDAMGSLIVYKKGVKSTGNKLMLCAHMDEVGLMVRRIADDGYLKFDTVGGIDRRVLIGKRVFVGFKRIPGVIGLKAYHLVSTEEEKKIPKLEEFYIDIGAKDKEAAEAQVSIGDFAVFDGETAEFGDGLLKAKAIDDRVGCAVMVKLLEEDLPMDCVFAFTVQEEVGTRGAFGAAFSVTPELALVLEGTTAADSPSMDDHKKVCSPGKGPVIPFMDGGTVYDRGLFELLRDLATTHGIPWQTKHYISGGTDASAIQRTKNGVRVCAVSAAVRYLHAPSGVASIRDFEQMYELAKAFIGAIAARSE